MDDQMIVSLYFERSESAISETDRKYGKLCYSIADRILNSRPDSEECVYDSYLGVWNAIPPTRPDSFRGFLCRIVRNISLMRFRKNTAKRRSRDLEVSLSELENILPDDNIPDGIEDRELGELIEQFLMSISEDRRNIFLRKYWFFDSISDICTLYGYSESKVKTSLHRTREQLRTYLNERGICV